MSADVCVCQHLLQAHSDWPHGGPCEMTGGCDCVRFVSEDPPVQMILVVETIVVEEFVVVAA